MGAICSDSTKGGSTTPSQQKAKTTNIKGSMSSPKSQDAWRKVKLTDKLLIKILHEHELNKFKSGVIP